MMRTVDLFTDGACRGNPGPGGWGALLRWNGHEREMYGGEFDTTNNRMELLAAIRGLQALTRPCRVIVTTDSRYVQQGITAWLPNWKRRDWQTANKKAVKNSDLWKQLDAEIARHAAVEWRWVKGHSGHPENDRADRLANRGIEELT